MTLIDAGKAVTAACSGALALELDERQYEIGSGPCLDAARTGREFHIRDMSIETRWPDFTPEAPRAGANSALSMPMQMGNHVAGSLNIYGTSTGAFSPPDAGIAACLPWPPRWPSTTAGHMPPAPRWRPS